MNWKWFPAFSLFCLIGFLILLYMAPARSFSNMAPAGSFSTNPMASFSKMKSKGKTFENSTLSLTMQNRIKGIMRPEEIMAIKCAKDGSFYMKWTGSNHKGREVIYKSGWNNGKALVKEGGTLGFASVSVGLKDPLIKMDYLRTLDRISLAAFVKEIVDWKEKGEASVDGEYLIIAREGIGKIAVSFYPDAAPAEVQIFNEAGKEVERYRLDNIKTYTAFPEDVFNWDNPKYNFPGYSKQGMYIDPEKLKTNLQRSWAKINDFTCTLIRQERIDGTMGPKHHMAIKFRKPCDIYAKWVMEPHLGRQILYRHGKDEKILAKEGGILGFTSVRIDVDSKLAMRGTKHQVTEIDIGFTLKTIYENLYRGMINGHIKLKFKGIKYYGGRRTYVVESWATDAKANGYYASHTVNAHDMKTGLPVHIENYDQNDQLFETITWTKIKFNTGLTEMDFSPENPEYGF